MMYLKRRAFITGIAATSALLPSQGLASIGGGFCPPGSGGASYEGPGGEVPPIPEDFVGKIPGEGPPNRSISLRCVHTGDAWSGQYVQDGHYIPEALEQLNWIAKDWRHREPTNMDPELWDLLYDLGEMLNIQGSQWRINSGYRNPASNASVGGARQSMHLRAKALDIASGLRPPSAIQGAARALQQRNGKGGVGTYNSFTHIDTRGSVSNWSG